MDTGHGGVTGQHGHHAARCAEPLRVHADPAALVPQDGHECLRRDVTWRGRDGHVTSIGTSGECGDAGVSRGWPSPSPVRVPVPTCVLAQQLPAGVVAGFGSFHARWLVGQGKSLCEAELAVPAPPALAVRVLPQPRVLGRDLPPDAQLVGDVAAALCKSEGGSGWVGGTGLPILPAQPVPVYLGSAELPSTARLSPAPRPRCGRPAGRCCGRQRAPAPLCSSRLGRSAPATP